MAEADIYKQLEVFDGRIKKLQARVDLLFEELIDQTRESVSLVGIISNHGVEDAGLAKIESSLRDRMERIQNPPQ